MSKTKLIRADWSFSVTSAASANAIDHSKAFNQEGASRVNLKLVVLKNNDYPSSFVDDENVTENNNGRKKEEAHQKEIIAMELTLPQFYEFARDLEIARKSLLEEKM
jgi:hypothetical protein